jgi:flagella basal body P-ring formation protein FlgA
MPNTLTSSFLLRFRLEVDGEEVGTWRIPMRASLTREVYFAGKTLPSGSAVDEETLLIRQIDTLELHNPAVAATESIDGFELTHTVSRGRPLLWRDLKTIPLVRSGEVVEAVAEDGLLHISMKAVALEDGGQDEFIRVRNPQSNKDLEAQVIDEKKVRVHF